jgi:hypothetical protein
MRPCLVESKAVHHFGLDNQWKSDLLDSHFRIQGSSQTFHNFHRQRRIDKGSLEFDTVATRQVTNICNVVTNLFNEILQQQGNEDDEELNTHSLNSQAGKL